MSIEAMNQFVNKLQEEENHRRDMDAIANSLPVKARKLKNCKAEYILGMMKELLGRLYCKSLPLDDDDCEANHEIMKSRMCQKIDDRGGMQYITDACSKSPVLKKAMTAVEKACDKKFMEKEMKLSDVDPKDLDYRFDADEEKSILDKIESDSEFDTISNVIKKEDEETEDLEQRLQNQEDMDSEEKFESAMSAYYFKHPHIYEPSLFEAIMLSNVKPYGESVTPEIVDQCFVETVMEYTALNVFKALKMESFDRESVKDLASKYLSE